MKRVFGIMTAVAVVVTIGLFAAYCGGGGTKCPDDCGAGKECCEACPCATGTCDADGQCVENTCCPEAPADKYYIDVTGMIMNPATGTGAEVHVTAISPMDALTNPTPTALAETDANASGQFALDCFDVTNVALGAVVLTDDKAGGGDNFFPTGTGVKGWDTNDEKVCVAGAVGFAVPNTMVAALDGAQLINSATHGFIMGMVISAAKAPVEGAVIKVKDGENWVDPTSIYYPNADFTAFDLMATSTNGIFIIPGPFALGTIRAEKTGMTFDEAKAASKAGFCYWSQNTEAE